MVSLGGIAITFVLWLVLRLFDRRRLWVQIVAALILAMPAAAMIALTNERVFADVQERVNAKIVERQGYALRRDQAGNLIIEGPSPGGSAAADGDDPLGSDAPRAQILLPGENAAGSRMLALLDLALGRYFLLLAWAALYFALLAGERARAAERREARFRNAAQRRRAAQLALPGQSALPVQHAELAFGAGDDRQGGAAEEMIQTLSSFYRHSLADDPTGRCRADRRVRPAAALSAIEALRFPDRLRVRIEVAGRAGRRAHSRHDPAAAGRKLGQATRSPPAGSR